MGCETIYFFTLNIRSGH